jgi:succinate dehydrogenase / fumarate reductase, cytochrome b subunit
MADTYKAKPARPEFRNIHVTQILKYRLPPAGIVSILHRVSGALMFVLMPFVIWMFDTSVTSVTSFAKFTSVFSNTATGWFFRLLCLALIWAFLHHMIAGVRHLWMDATHSVTKQHGHVSALITLGSSVFLTLVLMGKLFGWY